MVLEAVYEQDFWTVRTAFGQDGRRTRRWTPLAADHGHAMAAGSWKWTSVSSSTLWIMLICGSFFGSGYATGCCFD